MNAPLKDAALISLISLMVVLTFYVNTLLAQAVT